VSRPEPIVDDPPCRRTTSERSPYTRPPTIRPLRFPFPRSCRTGRRPRSDHERSPEPLHRARAPDATTSPARDAGGQHFGQDRIYSLIPAVPPGTRRRMSEWFRWPGSPGDVRPRRTDCWGSIGGGKGGHDFAADDARGRARRPTDPLARGDDPQAGAEGGRGAAAGPGVRGLRHGPARHQGRGGVPDALRAGPRGVRRRGSGGRRGGHVCAGRPRGRRVPDAVRVLPLVCPWA
jgi:hypothetical protein